MTMKSIVLFNFLIAISFGTIVNTDGQTWAFAEKNAIQEMKDLYTNNKNIVDARLEKAKDSALKKASHYKQEDIVNLPKATENKTFHPDMTYTLDTDIRNADGKLLYPKGYQFEIMKYTTLTMTIVVLDGTDEEQLEWYFKSGYNDALNVMTLLSNGDAPILREKFKKPIFYLSKPIVDRFSLKNVPCVIKQVEKGIEIKEHNVRKN